MSKVVYLFGAGASVGTLPLVNEMSKGISELISILSDDKLFLAKDEIFKDIEHAQGHSKRQYQMELIKALKDLQKVCDSHYSIDTYAKKLSIRGDNMGLKKLKVLLCIFFVIEQMIHRPNSRYDFFFASLIESIHRLPENIRILSWNYDTQFEIAFSEFSQKMKISDNQDLLKIYNRRTQIYPSDVEGFGIFKLNGSTELRYKNNSESGTYYFNGDLNASIDRIHLEEIVKMYVAATYVKDLTPSFLFAWEQGADSDYMNIVLKETNDAEVLVVIGYSFPYFNRTIDRKIISKMNNLRKVYFQSPEATELIERFKSIRDDLFPGQLVPISDLRYFYIPNELS